MDVVFYVKTLAVKLTSRRLELFDQWNNLGAPIASYYTSEELRRMVEEDPRAELLDCDPSLLTCPPSSARPSSAAARTRPSWSAAARTLAHPLPDARFPWPLLRG